MSVFSPSFTFSHPFGYDVIIKHNAKWIPNANGTGACTTCPAACSGYQSYRHAEFGVHGHSGGYWDYGACSSFYPNWLKDRFCILTSKPAEYNLSEGELANLIICLEGILASGTTDTQLLSAAENYIDMITYAWNHNHALNLTMEVFDFVQVAVCFHFFEPCHLNACVLEPRFEYWDAYKAAVVGSYNDGLPDFHVTHTNAHLFLH